jgi:hypothetical protein
MRQVTSIVCFMLTSSLTYLFILQMEAKYLSETFVNFQRNTRRYIPEDITLYNYRCCEPQSLQTTMTHLPMIW